MPSASATPVPPAGPPNIVLVVADDMGYGDLSSYGAPRTRTPNLDRLAADGVRFTQFSVPAALCTPSRAALLTGRYPPRSGLVGNLPSGPPDSGITSGEGSGGIEDEETTLAEALRARGYATGMVGKWHLGHQRPFLPTRHGFDSYFGLTSGIDPLLLLRGESRVVPPVEVDLLTRAYTEEAVRFIREARRPFFLYLAYRSPHVPLVPAPAFLGRSQGGLYGDVVEELDWSVGEVVRTLREGGLEANTLVVFLSDNGPWLSQGPDGGSPGPLFGGKGSPWEGGVRVPAMARWPGTIPAGRLLSEPTSSLDLFPTLLAFAGGAPGPERPADGIDVRRILTGEVTRLPGSGLDGGRELLSYVGSEAVALRSGRWKYVRPGFWSGSPGLFDLEADPGEAVDRLAEQPELAQLLEDRLRVLAADVARGAPQPKK